MSLGPITEERLRAVFAARTLITAREASDFLEISENTLRSIAESGAIGSTRIGATRRYSERDLRAFLEVGGCPSIVTKGRPTGNTISFSKGSQVYNSPNFSLRDRRWGDFPPSPVRTLLDRARPCKGRNFLIAEQFA